MLRVLWILRRSVELRSSAECVSRNVTFDTELSSDVLSHWVISMSEILSVVIRFFELWRHWVWRSLRLKTLRISNISVSGFSMFISKLSPTLRTKQVDGAKTLCTLFWKYCFEFRERFRLLWRFPLFPQIVPVNSGIMPRNKPRAPISKPIFTEQVSAAVTFYHTAKRSLIRISIRTPTAPTEFFFVVYLIPSGNVRTVPRSGHNHFLPDPC